MNETVDDIPSNIVAVVGMIILGLIAVTLCIYDIDRLMLESIIILVAGLSGYKLKDTIDKRKVKDLLELIENSKGDKN